MAKRKKKIILLSDHALSTSGVGVQSRHLIEGLLSKYPGEWSFKQFGAAIQHSDYETVAVSEDFIIKPIDGFGDPDLIRVTLASEQPDAIFLFTDPRFFIWLFEMEDEIHQMCPIVWWHVWDNRPLPKYNEVLYESTDLINCHSYLTYEICSEMFPEKTNFIPHSLPGEIFHPLSDNEIINYRKQVIGPERADHFVAFWINRNAKRKRPGDLLWAWKIFLDKLEAGHGHRNATLLMHTDPVDQEGPNLYSITEMLDITDNVVFSTERISFEQINVLHNISDTCVNISFAEGFGLSTLESMQCAKPIIAVKTGGLTRQVVDHRDGSENGVALSVDLQSIVGSQSVPYIYEDYTSTENIANGFLKLYDMGPEARKELGLKARDYVLDEFAHDKTIDLWHQTLSNTIEKWQQNYVRWQHIEV